jgi:hypothetical protein
VGESIEHSAFDWFFGIMSAYFALEVIKEAAEISASIRSGALAQYIFNGFNILDIGVFVCFALALNSFIEIRAIYSKLNGLSWMECFDLVTFCFKDAERYENIKGMKETTMPALISILTTHTDKLLICWGFMAIGLSIRTFKCFKVHPRLNIIAHTVFQTGEKLAYFMFAFMIVVLGYSFGGWVLYSAQLDAFATLGDSATTVLDMCLVGNTDYASMEAAHPVATIFYFWTFVFLLLLIMLNVLLAIVIDEYEAMREAQETEKHGTYVQFPMIHAMSRLPRAHLYAAQALQQMMSKACMRDAPPPRPVEGSYDQLWERLTSEQNLHILVDEQALRKLGVHPKSAREMMTHAVAYLGNGCLVQVQEQKQEVAVVAVEAKKGHATGPQEPIAGPRAPAPTPGPALPPLSGQAGPGINALG